MQTFFGGTIAMADLGVKEMWWGRESAFSPLTDRRNAYCVHSDDERRFNEEHRR